MRIIEKESVKGKIIYVLGISLGVIVGLSNKSRSYKLSKELIKELCNFNKKEDDIKRDLYRLRKQKFIEIKEVDGEQCINLTEKGEKIYLRFDYENLKFKNKKIWDRRWRMILFDIPNNKKRARDAFVNKLKEVGCVRFNNSVWIYPFPCQKEVDFVAHYWGIGKYIHFALVSKITNEESLCKYFKI